MWTGLQRCLRLKRRLCRRMASFAHLFNGICPPPRLSCRVQGSFWQVPITVQWGQTSPNPCTSSQTVDSDWLLIQAYVRINAFCMSFFYLQMTECRTLSYWRQYLYGVPWVELTKLATDKYVCQFVVNCIWGSVSLVAFLLHKPFQNSWKLLVAK